MASSRTRQLMKLSKSMFMFSLAYRMVMMSYSWLLRRKPERDTRHMTVQWQEHSEGEFKRHVLITETQDKTQCHDCKMYKKNIINIFVRHMFLVLLMEIPCLLSSTMQPDGTSLVEVKEPQNWLWNTEQQCLALEIMTHLRYIKKTLHHLNCSRRGVCLVLSKQVMIYRTRLWCRVFQFVSLNSTSEVPSNSIIMERKKTSPEEAAF